MWWLAGLPLVSLNLMQVDYVLLFGLPVSLDEVYIFIGGYCEQIRSVSGGHQRANLQPTETWDTQAQL